MLAERRLPSADSTATTSPARSSLRYLVEPSAMRAYACTAPALMRKGRDGTYSEGRVSPWIRHRAPEAEPIAIPSPGASLSIRSTQSLSPTPPDSTESTVAVDSSLEVGSASSSSVLVDANSLAAAQRVSESVSGGSKMASTPCSSAKAAPGRSTSSEMAAATRVPLPEAEATMFSSGIIVQSEHLTRIHGTIPTRERASSCPR